jgi:hypothetical protein
VFRQTSRGLKDLADVSYYSKQAFLTVWEDNIVKPYRGVSGPSNTKLSRLLDPMCLYTASKLQNLGLVYKSVPISQTTDSQRDRILTQLLSIFPQLKRVTVASHAVHLDPTVDVQTYDRHSLIFVFSWTHANSTHTCKGIRKHSSLAEWAVCHNISCPNGFGRSHGVLCIHWKTIGAPTTGWMARYWEIYKAFNVIDSPNLSKLGWPRAGRYENGTTGFKEAIQKVNEVIKNLQVLEKNFLKDVGAAGSRKRQKFEKEFLAELKTWPCGDPFSSSTDREARAKAIFNSMVLRTGAVASLLSK